MANVTAHLTLYPTINEDTEMANATVHLTLFPMINEALKWLTPLPILFCSLRIMKH